MFKHEKLPDGSVQLTIPVGDLPALVFSEEVDVAGVFRATDAGCSVIGWVNTRDVTPSAARPCGISDERLYQLWLDAVEISRESGRAIAEVMAELVGVYQGYFVGERPLLAPAAPNEGFGAGMDIPIDPLYP